jgi:predicted hotdog family 3-hydroxylacyl-ACP dehydratase
VIFPPIEDLVKHRRGMLLIDKVIAYDENNVTTQLTITKGATFLHDGHVPSWVGVEYAAQSVAALSGMRAHILNEKPKLGLLLSCRRYKTTRCEFKLDETLVIHAEEEFNDGQMGAYTCSILIEGETIATLSLSAYSPDSIDNIHLSQ